MGTIAAGVAKAKADVILISGQNGGTGASPATSIKYTGLPWEMGLSETHQVLTLNNLRDWVTLRTDGGLRTGRDIVVAAMMGAEEFGIGTAALISMGFIMVRQCQSNSCPVGVCTQRDDLRNKFTGTPEKVVNLITFYAQEIQETLASLGARSLDEVIGRTDMLMKTSRGAGHLDDLDLNPMLITVNADHSVVYDRNRPRQVVPDTLDADITRDAEPFSKDGEKMQLSYSVRNTLRTVGARVSSHIVHRFGMKNSLVDDHLTIKLTGSAGQSLGAFAAPGLKIEVDGNANDYVGVGLSGGTIVIRPPKGSRLDPSRNTIIGNTVHYGATAGRMFANCRAGERFCVRNSGAIVVVEGCGSNGCEYMTGGMAYTHDPDRHVSAFLNMDSIVSCPVGTPHWQSQLQELVTLHRDETGSPLAADILRQWDRRLPEFVQVCPKEMVDRLEHPLVPDARLRRA